MLNCIIIHFVAKSQSLRTKGDILCDTDKQSVKVLQTSVDNGWGFVTFLGCMSVLLALHVSKTDPSCKNIRNSFDWHQLKEPTEIESLMLLNHFLVADSQLKTLQALIIMCFSSSSGCSLYRSSNLPPSHLIPCILRCHMHIPSSSKVVMKLYFVLEHRKHNKHNKHTEMQKMYYFFHSCGVWSI